MTSLPGGLEVPAQDLEPREGESLDTLSPALSVLQRVRGHRSATDDVLAAWIAWTASPHASRVLDLGCGHGTVTLLLTQVLPLASFLAVEAQQVSASLARRNMLRNGLQSRVEVREQDLRTLGPSPGDGGFDLVTGTPPFMKLGSGVLPADPQRAAARFEGRGGIESYCEAAARLLRDGGRISMLMDAAQDPRCRAAFSCCGLRLDRIVVVEPRAGKGPRFRGYVGTRTAEAGGREPEIEGLVVRDVEGRYTRQMLALRESLHLPSPGSAP